MTALDDRPDVDAAPAGLAALRLPDDAPRPTHDVVNQVPPLVGHDVSVDPALREGLEVEGAGWYADRLTALGRRAGEARWQEAGRLTNEHEPRLMTHDINGRRVDEVEFHPAWHELSEVAVSEGLSGRAGVGDGRRRPAARLARRPGRRLRRLVPGRGRSRLPGVHDVRRGPCAARDAVRRRRGRPARHLRRLRPGPAPARGQARRDAGDGHDREAGRQRRPRQHHDRATARPAGRGAALRPPGAQVVHLGPAVRRHPLPRAGARRPVLLRGAARAARRERATACTCSG